MIALRWLTAAAALAVLACPGQAAEKRAAEYIVCIGDKRGEEMGALVRARDLEAVMLYARLHCWEIRPPAHDRVLQSKTVDSGRKVAPLPDIPPNSTVHWWPIKE